MNQQITAAPAEQSNAVPVDQAAERTTRTEPTEKLSKFLVRLSDEIEALDREKRLALFRKQIKSHQFFDGNFYGYVNDSCEWVSASQADTKEYQDDEFYSLIRTGLMELSRRKPEVAAVAAYSSEAMDNIAKFAQERIKANFDQTSTALLKQTENTYAVLNGITFRYTYFDFIGGGRKEKIPRLQKREASAHGALCANCLAPRNEAEEVCPECQSDVVLMGSSETDTIIGYDEIPNGKNVWVAPNPIGIIVSMQAATIEESPFIKWKQLILRAVLEEKYKGINLPSTGTISPELRYIGNQQVSTPSGDDGMGLTDESKINTASSGREMELLEHSQHWLDYPLYCNKTFDTPERMSDGTIIPAGETLGKYYPSGLYFTRVGDLITDMWDEDKNDKWTSSPYSLRAGSMYGAGTFNSHSDQELLNDLTVLKMANAWNNAVGREFVDPEKIKELSADPAKVTEVEGMADGESIIGRAYAQASPIPLGSEIYAIAESAKGSMQNKIGAFSGGAAGLADAQKWGDTATAISIKRDLAVGRFAPDLELMANNLDRKQAIQFLKNEQRFFTPEQWKRVQGDYNETAVRGFLECDIERDLVISIVPGSYMPKSESQTLSRLSNWAQITPVLMQMGNPELLAYAGEVFGIPKHLGGWDTDRAAAAQLLERFKQLSDMFAAQYGDLPTSDLTDPLTQENANKINEMAKIPVDVFLDNHQGIMDALKDWRGRDEGRTASNILLAAVAMRYVKHQTAVAKQAQMMQQLQIKAEAPLREQAQAEQQKQLEAQNADAEQQRADAEKQGILEVAGKAAELGETEAQRNHEAEENAADRERDVRVAAIASEERKPK
jgi:hypothetical protein